MSELYAVLRKAESSSTPAGWRRVMVRARGGTEPTGTIGKFLSGLRGDQVWLVRPDTPWLLDRRVIELYDPELKETASIDVTLEVEFPAKTMIDAVANVTREGDPVVNIFDAYRRRVERSFRSDIAKNPGIHAMERAARNRLQWICLAEEVGEELDLVIHATVPIGSDKFDPQRVPFFLRDIHIAIPNFSIYLSDYLSHSIFLGLDLVLYREGPVNEPAPKEEGEWRDRVREIVIREAPRLLSAAEYYHDGSELREKIKAIVDGCLKPFGRAVRKIEARTKSTIPIPPVETVDIQLEWGTAAAVRRIPFKLSAVVKVDASHAPIVEVNGVPSYRSWLEQHAKTILNEALVAPDTVDTTINSIQELQETLKDRLAHEASRDGLSVKVIAARPELPLAETVAVDVEWGHDASARKIPFKISAEMEVDARRVQVFVASGAPFYRSWLEQQVKIALDAVLASAGFIVSQSDYLSEFSDKLKKALAKAAARDGLSIDVIGMKPELPPEEMVIVELDNGEDRFSRSIPFKVNAVLKVDPQRVHIFVVRRAPFFRPWLEQHAGVILRDVLNSAVSAEPSSNYLRELEARLRERLAYEAATDGLAIDLRSVGPEIPVAETVVAELAWIGQPSGRITKFKISAAIKVDIHRVHAFIAHGAPAYRSWLEQHAKVALEAELVSADFVDLSPSYVEELQKKLKERLVQEAAIDGLSIDVFIATPDVPEIVRTRTMRFTTGAQDYQTRDGSFNVRLEIGIEGHFQCLQHVTGLLSDADGVTKNVSKLEEKMREIVINSAAQVLRSAIADRYILRFDAYINLEGDKVDFNNNTSKPLTYLADEIRRKVSYELERVLEFKCEWDDIQLIQRDENIADLITMILEMRTFQIEILVEPFDKPGAAHTLPITVTYQVQGVDPGCILIVLRQDYDKASLHADIKKLLYDWSRDYLSSLGHERLKVVGDAKKTLRDDLSKAVQDESKLVFGTMVKVVSLSIDHSYAEKLSLDRAELPFRIAREDLDYERNHLGDPEYREEMRKQLSGQQEQIEKRQETPSTAVDATPESNTNRHGSGL